jgi:hypothetical protein
MQSRDQRSRSGLGLVRCHRLQAVSEASRARQQAGQATDNIRIPQFLTLVFVIHILHR